MTSQEKQPLIIGILLSAYLPDHGPSPIYWELEEDSFSRRDRLSMAIKNISLLMGDLQTMETRDLRSIKYFGVLPFADLRANSLSFFFYVQNPEVSNPVAVVLAILFNEHQRTFLFDNITLLRPVIREIAHEINQELEKTFEINWDKFRAFGKRLRKALWDVFEKPLAPISPQRKIKLLLTGLDNSGKTSYLIALERKYSKLMGVQVTRGAERGMVEMLGTQIFQWDLGGQKKFREKYLARPETYLVDADLVFFFIDITEPSRFAEAKTYFEEITRIYDKCDKHPPIVFCLNKIDPDIEELFTTREAVANVKNTFKEYENKHDISYFETSIFSFPSVMTSFSYGLSRLSPNRSMLRLQLEWLANIAHLQAVLLLTPSGLVLSEFHRKKNLHPSVTYEKVFEVTAPQFAELFQKFQDFRLLAEGKALYRFSSSQVIGFIRFALQKDLYLMVLTDSEGHLEHIEDLFPEFRSRIQDLLSTYIS